MRRTQTQLPNNKAFCVLCGGKKVMETANGGTITCPMCSNTTAHKEALAGNRLELEGKKIFTCENCGQQGTAADPGCVALYAIHYSYAIKADAFVGEEFLTVDKATQKPYGDMLAPQLRAIKCNACGYENSTGCLSMPFSYG